MKTVYRILVSALGVLALAWCLPWLYSMLLPEGLNDPFVVFSPVNNTFIVSETEDKNTYIYAVDDNGNIVEDSISKDRRDQLVPQTFFNQLIARGEIPDTIDGDSVSVQLLKQNQWTFSSIPHDVNKRKAQVYPIMESMPARFELEDAEEVFVIRDGITFIDIKTNEVDRARSDRFAKVFADRGVKFPLKDLNANITTRKPADEGYLIIDAGGDVFHMKMQGGQPFLAKVNMPADVKAEYVFVLENTEPRHIGIVAGNDKHLYAVEKEGHKVVKLPGNDIDPTTDRISIYKTYFNWVIKVRDDKGARWIAMKSTDYTPLGEYSIVDDKSDIGTAAEYIFPFSLSFTDISDSLGYPRFADFSWRAVFLNIALAMVVALLACRRRSGVDTIAVNTTLTLILGIFYFIVYLTIKD